MQELLEYLVKELTGSEEITVEQTEEESLNVYTITAPQSVMGLLIGREGKIIRAVRTLARARAIVDQVGITIKLQEA